MAELLPNFYKVTHSEHINETDWVVQVMLNPQHAIYSGHFPQQPVVPGVCMLQIIKRVHRENTTSSPAIQADSLMQVSFSY